MQGLVPSLAGLARVMAADEPDEAKRLVERVLGLGEGLSHVYVLLSAGWVALVHGERDRAAERAAAAAATARRRRDRAGLAESLELGVLAARHPAGEIERLDEAAAIWRDLRQPGGRGPRRARDRPAHRGRSTPPRTPTTGSVRWARGATGRRSRGSSPPTPRHACLVQSLGRFRVTRGGEVIPLAAWQSRKARDLFKILVARRGRPTPREALMEALWPGQSAGSARPTGCPCCSAPSGPCSTPRSVTSPTISSAADQSSVRLQPEHVSVDVEEFLTAAGEALALRRAGAPRPPSGSPPPRPPTRATSSRRTPTRTGRSRSARSAGPCTPRSSARSRSDATSRGDADAAIRFYLRVLERDPYDEPAHLGLVTALEAAGRHGEARRCFRAYCARMDEIGIESAPFPAPAGVMRSLTRRSKRT